MLKLTTNIACPNCGNEADRQYFLLDNFSRSRSEARGLSHCPICDYLIVNCDRPQKTFKGRKADLRYASKQAIAYLGGKSYE